jgi:hypothetical protein
VAGDERAAGLRSRARSWGLAGGCGRGAAGGHGGDGGGAMSGRRKRLGMTRNVIEPFGLLHAARRQLGAALSPALIVLARRRRLLGAASPAPQPLVAGYECRLHQPLVAAGDVRRLGT